MSIKIEKVSEASCIPVQYIGMKYYLFAGFVLSLVLLAACENGPIASSYRLVLPEPPSHWKEILEEPHWRIEWIDTEGSWRELNISPGMEAPELSFLSEWTTPALAWPVWPSLGLEAGMMRPSGALFPWDISGGKLYLDWTTGAEAFFWKELATAERTTSATERRLPWYFDWPRFRTLLTEGNISEAVRQDPWLADWKDIAQRTVQSGFDSRRITSRSYTKLEVPGMGGFWISSSPFTPPLEAPPDGPLVLNVLDTPDIWISQEGILKCSTSGWVWRERR